MTVRAAPLQLNPLVVKGMREEMRARKLFFLAPVYISLLSIVALVAVSGSSGADFNPLSLSGTSRVTLYAFDVAVTILLGLIALVLGASSFTTEREKFTYELLELTPLTYGQMVAGKFVHIMLVLLFILLSSLPVFATLFFMGGLNFNDLILSLYYLVLFFAALTLATICISVTANRTIFGIILCLAAAFLISVASSIMTGALMQQPRYLGFGMFSPWLVTWQQVFNPVPIRLSGHPFPVWPLYTVLYVLLCGLFASWARNTLDARKLERNVWPRVLGFLLILYQVAVGMACMRSYAPVSAKDLEAIYTAAFLLVVVGVPFFGVGRLNEKDWQRFSRAPLLDSLNPKRLWINYPPTGHVFLLVLILCATAVIKWLSRSSWETNAGYVAMILSWVVPWFLAFVALRLLGLQARGMFSAYLLGTVFYMIVCAFEAAGRTAKTFLDFFLAPGNVPGLFVLAVLFLGIVRARHFRRLRSAAADAGGSGPPRAR